MARTERELTDAQWAGPAPLLPPQRPEMGRPPRDRCSIVEAIVWLDRSGAPGRDLPANTALGDGLERYLRRRGIRAVVPSKSDQPRQPRFDKAADRQRNQMERTINSLKGWRRVATRYQKREVNYLAM